MSDPSRNETVTIGSKLWKSLGLDDTPTFISLSASTRGQKIVCNAVLNQESQHVDIPAEWLQKLRAPAESLTISKVNPVQLTQVFTTALSDEAYHVAAASPLVLESWFCKPGNILRQGETYTVRSELPLVNGSGGIQSPDSLQFRVDMLEPVLQGLARQGSTKFYVVSAPVDDDVNESPEPSEDAIEIDEIFLASSVRHPNLRPSSTGSEAIFDSQRLNSPISTLDEDHLVYVRTSDLGRIGILDGDWAVAQRKDQNNYRLVRVMADDEVVKASGLVAADPLLLWNATGSHSFQGPLCIHPSPFGSGQPVIPTARSVTVARIASPYTVDKSYQSQFLRALKAHFGLRKRLVKSGDMIALAIDANVQSESDDDDNLRDHSSGFKNELVYFLITNVEHDILPCKETGKADLYVGSTTGELGCWVDPAISRVVQVGIEHARVPNLMPYVSLAGKICLNPGMFPTICGPSSAYQKLLDLASATLAPHASAYSLRLSVLLKGSRGIGKATTVRGVCQSLGLHLLEVNCYDLLGDTDIKTEGTLRARFDKAADCSPCIILLRNLDAFMQSTQPGEMSRESSIARALEECIAELPQIWTRTGYPLLVCATVHDSTRLSPDIMAGFKHEISLQVPSESERYEILRVLLADSTLSPDVSLKSLAIQTAALLPVDLVDLISRVELEAVKHAYTLSPSNDALDFIHAGIPLAFPHFENALHKARASYSESIGAPKIPHVSWDDVGGLAHVKSDILDTVQLPLQHPELFASGLKKRSGILLYGPPGTGKTLVAKAVATSFSLNFFSVKGPELLNMYIGESEANVRRVFQRARDAKPCVIFFDELDSIAPKRGNQGDSGGVMDRIVSQLLAELDGMSENAGDVFVLGATNRPDLLDPALLRPGRFDRMLYLGVSTTHEDQLKILQALTRKFVLGHGVDLAAIAQRCPFNYTGADFYALCADALLNAMTRTSESLDKKIDCLNQEQERPFPLTPQFYLAEMASPSEKEVVVLQEDFERAFESLIPSVSESEMDYYANVQERFSLRS